MSISSPRSALATVAAVLVACCAATRPAAAQQALAVHATAGGATVRPVALYRFATPIEAGLPTQVTIADSAGALVASYRLAGDRAVRPLTVAVLDADLVLQGEAPAGLLTLVLERQNDVPAGAVAGRWALGARQGALRGRTR